jgi:ElaA protein
VRPSPVPAPQDVPETAERAERAEIRAAGATAIDAHSLYRILRLRSEVFVVEQDCAFLDLDGRDLEEGTTHLWIDGDPAEPTVMACARVLAEPNGESTIGRIVTHPDHRSRGLAERLIHHALSLSEGPFLLKAQTHLGAYYARFGFARAGPDFIEDGISHTPMRRGRGDRGDDRADISKT